MEFQAGGDILRALDKRRDGYAVRARLTWFDPLDHTLQKEYVTDPNSRGTSRTRIVASAEWGLNERASVRPWRARRRSPAAVSVTGALPRPRSTNRTPSRRSSPQMRSLPSRTYQC